MRIGFSGPPPPPPPPFPNEHTSEALTGGRADVSIHRVPAERIDSAYVEGGNDIAQVQFGIEYPQPAVEPYTVPLPPAIDMGVTHEGEHMPVIDPYWPY